MTIALEERTKEEDVDKNAVTGKTFEIGMVGLGVMGRNFALNMADKGFSVAGYDQDPSQGEALLREGEGRPVASAATMEGLVRLLRAPRAVMVLVPAGPSVDAVIESILPRLAPGDVLMDGGNSFFRQTDERAKRLAGKSILYMGVGISGGERGARFGPSIMPGGTIDAYGRVRSILEAAAAKVDGEPCVAFLGPAPAGHYVKMVHNGIEYGMMQLIAESYDLMKRGLCLSNEELGRVYDRWNASDLRGYLVEITSRIFNRKDEVSGRSLVDLILDEAKQKGTGMWTAQDAMELRVPVPTVGIAVAMRDLSDLREDRQEAAATLTGPARQFAEDKEGFIGGLGHAMGAAMAILYAQGMAQLRGASRAYGYGLNLAEVARIWRGGCIIRSDMLEPMRQAFRAKPDLRNLLLDPAFSERVRADQADLRRVVCAGANHGIPVPALSACLGYFDAFRSEWLPANLVQAQRDYFGSHKYRRTDKEGLFHTEWE